MLVLLAGCSSTPAYSGSLRHQFSDFNNPVYFVRPADLPPPLRALIDLVPSTSERLIVP
jgi:hypothetical protein